MASAAMTTAGESIGSMMQPPGLRAAVLRRSDRLNIQTSFLSPPVAMAPFYLKGVAPKD
jgi:hypothetical protein